MNALVLNALSRPVCRFRRNALLILRRCSFHRSRQPVSGCPAEEPEPGTRGAACSSSAACWFCESEESWRGKTSSQLAETACWEPGAKQGWEWTGSVIWGACSSALCVGNVCCICQGRTKCIVCFRWRRVLYEVTRPPQVSGSLLLMQMFDSLQLLI